MIGHERGSRRDRPMGERHLPRLFAVTAALALGAFGCGGGGGGVGMAPDGGMDTGSPGMDSGPPGLDSGPPMGCPLDQCAIDGVCVGQGDVDPDNPCAQCELGRARDAWSPRPAGLACRPAAGDCDTVEVCDGVSLACPTDAFLPAETPCGDPTTDTVCDAPDSCDGAGTCLPRYVGPGTPCGASDEVVTECDGPDVCDGAGACGPGYAVVGAPCGDTTTDTGCDAPDSCDGAGLCASNYAAAETPCGDAATDTICDAPDTCDGAGVCASNYASSTTPCGADPGTDACTLAPYCDGAGVCPAPTPAANGTACGAGLRCFDTACGPRTWIALGPVAAPSDGAVGFRPLAVSARGGLSFSALWGSAGGTNAIYASAYGSASDTFAEPTQVPGTQLAGWIAVFGGVDYDAAGHGTLAYTLGDVAYASEHPAGDPAWGPRVELRRPATSSPRPAVASGDDGSALVVYAYSTGDLYNRPALVASHRDASGAYARTDLTSGGYFDDGAHPVVWPTGDAAAAWVETGFASYAAIKARAYLPGATTPGWQPASTGPATSPAILRAAALDDGRLLVVYTEAGVTGTGAFLATLWDPVADTWTTPVPLGDATIEVPSALALASNGATAVLAWVGRDHYVPPYAWQPTRDDYRMRARRYDLATDTWSGPITVVENESVTSARQLSPVEDLQVVMNASGDVLFGWRHRNSVLAGGGRATQAVVQRFVPDDGAWAEPLAPGPGDSELPGDGFWAPVVLASEADADTTGPLQRFMVSLDDDGYAAAIWQDGLASTVTEGLRSAVYR